MTNGKDDLFKYISYLTLREGWAEIKGTFFGWLILSATFMAVGAFVEFGASKTETFWSILPTPVWYVLAFAVFAWSFRGEELRIVLPKTFKLWLLVTTGVALIVFAGTILPAWALIPVYWAVVFGFEGLDSLAKIGQENYQKLSEQPNNSA